jgi:hypothetical protein
MPGIELTHTFEVECETCNATLGATWGTYHGTDDYTMLRVETCTTCTDAAVAEAVDEAVEEASRHG